MAENMKDRDFVEYVVKQLVDNPDDVKVERKIDEMGVLITLDVNPNDMGMVIGREGMTAKALRTLLRVIGARNNARVNLKINEPEGSERRPRYAESSGGASPRYAESSGGASPRSGETSPRESREEHPVISEEKSEEKKTLDDVMNDIQI
jgi:predicted RNA-binding protein YlqC (UPF0109 family)